MLNVIGNEVMKSKQITTNTQVATVREHYCFLNRLVADLQVNGKVVSGSVAWEIFSIQTKEYSANDEKQDEIMIEVGGGEQIEFSVNPGEQFEIEFEASGVYKIRTVNEGTDNAYVEVVINEAN